MRYLGKFQHKQSLPFFSREESCFTHGYWQQLNEGLLGVPYLGVPALVFAVPSPDTSASSPPQPHAPWCLLLPSVLGKLLMCLHLCSMTSSRSKDGEVNPVPSAPMIILLSTSFYNSGDGEALLSNQA